jgi:hypothetical protein
MHIHAWLHYIEAIAIDTNTGKKSKAVRKLLCQFMAHAVEIDEAKLVHHQAMAQHAVHAFAQNASLEAYAIQEASTEQIAVLMEYAQENGLVVIPGENCSAAEKCDAMVAMIVRAAACFRRLTSFMYTANGKNRAFPCIECEGQAVAGIHLAHKKISKGDVQEVRAIDAASCVMKVIHHITEQTNCPHVNVIGDTNAHVPLVFEILKERLEGEWDILEVVSHKKISMIYVDEHANVDMILSIRKKRPNENA